jgi:tetratricopeptide (TPR) repeat protein
MKLGRIQVFLGAAIIAFGCFFVYEPSLRGEFLFDDASLVAAGTQEPGLDGLRRIWLEKGFIPQYYPLTHTSWWLQSRVTDLDPLPLHAGNVALHALNSLLLWWLLWRLKVPLPWLGAAVFAVHPICVESVAWLSERKNVLSGLFFLAAFHAYLGHVERASWIRYGCALALFTLALLSKTSVAVLPALLLLVVWVREGTLMARRWAEAVPFLALAGLAALATIGLESADRALDPEAARSFGEKLAVAGRAPWFYAEKIIFPASLFPIYERWQTDPSSPVSYGAGIAAVAVTAALFALTGRFGRAPAAWTLAYLAALFPAMGFFYVAFHRFSFVADHFAYLAAMVLIPAVVSLGAWAVSRSRFRVPLSQPWVWLLAVAPLMPLALKSNALAANYATALGFWRRAAEDNPKAWVAHQNLGVIAVQNGWDVEARDRFRATLRLKPGHYEALSNLATLLASSVDPTVRNPSEAVRLARELCEGVEGKTPQNLYVLAQALHADGRSGEAVDVLVEARSRAEAARDAFMLENIERTLRALGRSP